MTFKSETKEKKRLNFLKNNSYIKLKFSPFVKFNVHPISCSTNIDYYKCTISSTHIK